MLVNMLIVFVLSNVKLHFPLPFRILGSFWVYCIVCFLPFSEMFVFLLSPSKDIHAFTNFYCYLQDCVLVSAFTIGKGVVAGASVLGLGALCFYGLGLSSEVGAIDRMG